MKTQAELEKDILKITMKIHSDFPELSKYIAEMPENESGNNKIENSIKSFKSYYNSLLVLVSEYAKTHKAKKVKKKEKKANFPDYPIYQASEDIYVQGKKEMDIDPSVISKKKTPIDAELIANVKSFSQDKSGKDLDVPESELDDQQESVGSEDEENNYYSLGGDNHNDLEEDKG